jgi:predicted Rdx family selenoprotein
VVGAQEWRKVAVKMGTGGVFGVTQIVFCEKILMWEVQWKNFIF